MITKFHFFYPLPLSPWPLLSSVSAFNLLLSLLMFFKMNLSYFFLMNMINISLISFLWWASYSGEMSLEGLNSCSLESGLKMGMILFISSEVFFFFSFFWSYFHFYLSPCLEIGLAWPPVNVEMFDFLNVPLINTLVLLTSGVTITISHFYLSEGGTKLCKIFLTLTIFLGLIFTFLQAMEYNSSFFSISDSSFGTSFFMLTGFHGCHVIIGSIFLATVLYRFYKFSPSKMECLSFELSAWYWHFVDVVWLFLYTIIYYLNN